MGRLNQKPYNIKQTAPQFWMVLFMFYFTSYSRILSLVLQLRGIISICSSFRPSTWRAHIPHASTSPKVLFSGYWYRYSSIGCGISNISSLSQYTALNNFTLIFFTAFRMFFLLRSGPQIQIIRLGTSTPVAFIFSIVTSSIIPPQYLPLPSGV